MSVLADAGPLEREDPAPHPRTRASTRWPTPGSSQLADARSTSPPRSGSRLEYLDWKSGGDTNFAPLASADGQLDCRGFWDKGKTDKDALWTSNAEICADAAPYVDGVGANFGRVRVIKLEPQDRDRPSAASTATTTTGSTPTTTAGSCAAGWS